MKKIVMVLSILAVCCITVLVPSAKSLKGVTLYGEDKTELITKYGTEGNFHTSIYPLSKNEDTIQIINIVFRKNSSGNYVKIVRNTFDMKEVKRSYILNISVKGTADTRSIWQNLTKGTKVTADLYINNGYDYDINIVPTFINALD